MAAWRYEISLLVLKYFSTLEEKCGISARPCNILYVFSLIPFSGVLRATAFKGIRFHTILSATSQGRFLSGFSYLSWYKF